MLAEGLSHPRGVAAGTQLREFAEDSGQRGQPGPTLGSGEQAAGLPFTRQERIIGPGHREPGGRGARTQPGGAVVLATGLREDGAAQRQPGLWAWRITAAQPAAERSYQLRSLLSTPGGSQRRNPGWGDVSSPDPGSLGGDLADRRLGYRHGVADLAISQPQPG